MRHTLLLYPLIASLVPGAAFAQGQSQGHAVLIPDSSIERPEDHGVRAHTNHMIRFGPEAVGTKPSGETPASLKAVYGLPTDATVGPNTGAIALVLAYDYPTAENDLNVFSSAFGLPACRSASGCFTKIYAGKKPRTDCGWAQEAALDIEWSHAMSPNAKIILVVAASNRFQDLFSAVDAATKALKPYGGGQVSMSWGGSEFSGEASYDSHFNGAGIAYFAASGDTGGATIYPGVSPNVVSAGGTSIARSGTSFTETGWSGSGGGPSKYEAMPSYQSNAGGQLSGGMRGAPDLSFDADPNSGVSVYDSTSCQGMSGWMVFGGTSVASPSLAGIVNFSNHGYDSAHELSAIYAPKATFRDITSGTAGGNSAAAGWDYVTGVGVVNGTTNQ